MEWMTEKSRHLTPVQDAMIRETVQLIEKGDYPRSKQAFLTDFNSTPPRRLLPASRVRTRILYLGKQLQDRTSRTSRPNTHFRSWGISPESACGPR
jgi:hypothetical protein